MHTYLQQTRSASYGFLSALPLLVTYEILILAVNRGQAQHIRVGADIWIKQFLFALGGKGHIVLGMSVALVGLVILMKERRQTIDLRPRYFIGIVVESVVYAIVIALVVSGITQRLFSQAVLIPMSTAPPASPLFNVALSIGAGLYEELVFRVILVGGLFLLLREIMGRKVPAYIIATLIGSALFSAVHHLGEFGDPFTWPVFFFRFLFAIILQALYLARGFGVAAWTHALYDILVVLLVGSL